MIYVTKSESGVTWSNWSIVENGVSSIPFECSKDDLVKVTEGTKEFDVVDGKVFLKDSRKKAEQDESERITKEKKEAEDLVNKARKKELISKIVSGKATDKEQTEFAELLN